MGDLGPPHWLRLLKSEVGSSRRILISCSRSRMIAIKESERPKLSSSQGFNRLRSCSRFGCEFLVISCRYPLRTLKKLILKPPLPGLHSSKASSMRSWGYSGALFVKCLVHSCAAYSRKVGPPGPLDRWHIDVDYCPSEDKEIVSAFTFAVQSEIDAENLQIKPANPRKNSVSLVNPNRMSPMANSAA
jgi:hypothetical protein